jgi:hypothetical protein
MRTFGNKLDSVLQGIYKSNEKYRAATEAWRANNPGAYKGAANPHLRALEEVIAHEAEAGRISAPVWDRVVSAVKDFGRTKLGFKLDYSNREVQAILARAHDNIIGGGKNAKATTSEGPAFARRQAAKTVNDLTGLDQSKEYKKAQQLLESAHNAQDWDKGFGALTQGILKDPKVAADAVAALPEQLTKLGIKALNTKDVERLANRAAWKLAVEEESAARIKAKKPPLTAAEILKIRETSRLRGPDSVRNAVRALNRDIIISHRDLENPNGVVQQWIKYRRASAANDRALSDAIHIATIYDTHSSGKTLQSLLASDPTLLALRKAKAGAKVIASRENEIKTAYSYYDKLNPKGKELFSKVLEAYKEPLAKYEQLMQANIKKLGLDKTEEEARLKANKEFFDEIKKNVPVYAMLGRNGDYWFRVGKGKNSEVYSFVNPLAREHAMRERVDMLQKAGDKRTLDEHKQSGSITYGDKMSDLRPQISDADKTFKTLLKTLDETDSQGVNTDFLKDQITQLWLQNQPGRSILKQAIHRQNRMGFTGDALSTFTRHQFNSVRQLAKLEHGMDIKNALGEAKGEIEGRPSLSPYINQIEQHAMRELNAPPTTAADKIATSLTKGTFLWMLSGPKTALANMTQLPIVGIPMLAARHGLKLTLATLAKYAPMWKTFSTAVRDEAGNITTRWSEPTIVNSEWFRNLKGDEQARLKRFWQDGYNNGKFMDTLAADLSNRSRVPTTEHESVLSQGARAAETWMGGLFQLSESVSRQMMHMASAELEYAKAIKEGLAPEAAEERAMKAASQMVDDAMFDFSSYNKSWLAKSSPWTRVPMQFLNYSTQITSYIVRNFASLSSSLPPEERKAAAIRLFGMLGMTWMFAGTAGLPFYTKMMNLATGLRDTVMPPDPEDNDPDSVLSTPSLDLWFRQKFIPEYFGEDSSLAKALGVNTAAMMGRAALSGPVSALTDMDIGSSVSLDNIWFRDDTPSSSNRAALASKLLSYATGPFGSLALQGASALDDFDKGDYNRGIEKILPAFLSGPARAYRFGTEGNLTPQGETIENAEWYTTGKLVAQAAGLPSTEVDELQTRNFLAKNITNQQTVERSNILDQINRAYDAMSRDPSDANTDAFNNMLDEAVKFSIANPYLKITGPNITASIKGRAKAKATAFEGYAPNRRALPYVSELLGEPVGGEQQ